MPGVTAPANCWVPLFPTITVGTVDFERVIRLYVLSSFFVSKLFWTARTSHRCLLRSEAKRGFLHSSSADFRLLVGLFVCLSIQAEPFGQLGLNLAGNALHQKEMEFVFGTNRTNGFGDREFEKFPLLGEWA